MGIGDDQPIGVPDGTGSCAAFAVVYLDQASQGVVAEPSQVVVELFEYVGHG
jgi:hypothetical protein